MKCPRRLGFALVLVFFALAATVQSHDEPPKTQAEKAEQARNRNKFKERGVKLQQLWIVKQNDTTQIVDSSLFLANRFDRSGNLVEQIVFDKANNSRSVSLYDDQCQWLEELSYSGDTLEERNVFVYNRGGVIDRVVSYDNQGRITGQLDYQYRDSAQQISVTKTGPPDSLQYTILYSFEPSSNFERQLEAVQRNSDGSLKMKAQNLFEGKQRTRKLVFGPDGKLLHSFSYSFTSESEVSEIRKYTPHDSLVFRQTYQYTPNGLLSTIVERDAGDTIKRTLQYVYEYFDMVR
jgi:hypothetical protein